jgi:hypothetical protein
MAVADKIIALMDAMTQASLDSLSPVRRRQFADLCRHWAEIAGRPEDGQAAMAGRSHSVDPLMRSDLVSIDSAPAKRPSGDAEP